MTPRRGTVLITGAAGFVGRALVSCARAEGWQVRAAARHPRSAVMRDDAIEPIVSPELGPDADWRHALQGVEAVVHAAARVHVARETSADPLAEFRRVNTDGTLALARQAAAAGVRRFVFVSTIGVNGAETHDRPFRADDAPAPHSPYAVSKLDAERQLAELAAASGLEVVVVRPPLVYGPDAPGNFGRLVRALQRGLPLPLASVRNLRSFVGVDNLCALLVTCLDHPQASGQTLLVSDGEDLSTPELLRRTAAALCTRARLLPFPVPALRAAAALAGRAAVAQQLCGSLQADIVPTCERLQWAPPHGVDEQLARAVAPLLRAGDGRC